MPQGERRLQTMVGFARSTPMVRSEPAASLQSLSRSDAAKQTMDAQKAVRARRHRTPMRVQPPIRRRQAGVCESQAPKPGSRSHQGQRTKWQPSQVLSNLAAAEQAPPRDKTRRKTRDL